MLGAWVLWVIVVGLTLMLFGVSRGILDYLFASPRTRFRVTIATTLIGINLVLLGASQLLFALGSFRNPYTALLLLPIANGLVIGAILVRQKPWFRAVREKVIYGLIILVCVVMIVPPIIHFIRH